MVIAGRYRLEREIARGGMGAVWLGRDELLGRTVAMKRIGLLPGASGPDLERATREARLAAALNHPHVVAVFDQVREGDEHWLVMEYVEGSTLAELIRERGPMTPAQLAPLLRQAADALAAAHAEGIVHRDVKPSNLLVTPRGQVKITDFGIARMQADPSLTQTGLVTGSPAYLAPEVASGRRAQAPADVWALGATCFHALAGHPPYDVGENVIGALYRIVHEDPPRLEDAGWLGPLLEATMVTDPAARWTMAQVADYLARGQGGRPPLARAAAGAGATRQVPASPPPAAAVADPGPDVVATVVQQPPARRSRRWLWIALVVAVLAILTAFALPGLLDGGDPANSGAEPSPSETTSETTEAEEDQGPTAEQIEDFITEYLRLVTSDRDKAWGMLTPAFQSASNGRSSYDAWWSQWDSATPSNIKADPDGLTVSYTVKYTDADGRTQTDNVSLFLEYADDTLRIAGEA